MSNFFSNAISLRIAWEYEKLADKRDVEDSKTIRAGCRPPVNANWNALRV